MAVPDKFVGAATLRVAADADVSTWVEALAARECTPDEFLAQILRSERKDPDACWEALSLLDQMFRRHRISRDVYTDLKNRLHQHTAGDIARPAAAPAPVTPPPAAAPPPADPPFKAPPEPPAAMVATRSVPLAELPVITTELEAETPAGPVEVALHGELRVGDQLRGRYRVVEILRRDAAGTLVEAIDEQKIEMAGVRKRVAIQVVNETLARDRDYLHRLGKLQSLSHPTIARLFDVEEDEGTLFLVMELLNGPSLEDLLARTGSSRPHVSVAQSALRAVANGLAYAHSQGVVHGDVSARNIFLNQAGEFRVQGFELQGAGTAAADDRFAFARLAYEVLADSRAVDPQMERLPLRSPPGITRAQWRALRRTLKRKGGDHGLLAAFAGETPGGSSKGWRNVAILAVVLVLGVAVYLYVNATLEPATRGVSRVTPITRPAPPARAPAVTRATVTPAPAVSAAPPPDFPVVTTTPRATAAQAAARPHIDLPVRFASVDTMAPVARIWVRRRDNLDRAVTFKWWTESGSAEVDRDFRQILPRTETIPAGAPGLEVLVPLMPDPDRRDSRTFWVKIDEVSRGAILGESTLMQVAIVPTGT